MKKGPMRQRPSRTRPPILELAAAYIATIEPGLWASKSAALSPNMRLLKVAVETNNQHEATYTNNRIAEEVWAESDGVVGGKTHETWTGFLAAVDEEFAGDPEMTAMAALLRLAMDPSNG